MSYINVTPYIYILYFYLLFALPGSDVSWNCLVRTVRGLQTVRKLQMSQKDRHGDQLWPSSVLGHGPRSPCCRVVLSFDDGAKPHENTPILALMGKGADKLSVA